jgi:hypothetical protein
LVAPTSDIAISRSLQDGEPINTVVHRHQREGLITSAPPSQPAIHPAADPAAPIATPTG